MLSICTLFDANQLSITSSYSQLIHCMLETVVLWVNDKLPYKRKSFRRGTKKSIFPTVLCSLCAAAASILRRSKSRGHLPQKEDQVV